MTHPPVPAADMSQPVAPRPRGAARPPMFTPPFHALPPPVRPPVGPMYVLGLAVLVHPYPSALDLTHFVAATMLHQVMGGGGWSSDFTYGMLAQVQQQHRERDPAASPALHLHGGFATTTGESQSLAPISHVSFTRRWMDGWMDG